MKSFSKFQKISSLVLALVMTLSLALPYVKTVEAADDTTGWTVGSSSTVTGNATDGWVLSVSGNMFATSGVGNFYSTNTCISNLQVEMDLSALTGTLYLSFGVNTSAGNSGAWSTSNTKLLFTLKKTSDTALELRAQNSSNYVCDAKTITVDYSQPIKFEFLEIDGKWLPAINDATYAMEYEGTTVGSSTFTTTDAFIENMITNYPGTMVVGFSAGGSDLSINNVKFIEKVSDGWTKGTTSSISGNATDGWKLTALGNGATTAGVGNFYTTNTSITNLQMTLDLSTLQEGRDLWLSFGPNESLAYSGAWATSNTKALFILKKLTGTSTLQIQAHTGGAHIVTTKQIENFDFTNPHVFEFLKEDDVWKPAIDGTTYEIATETTQSESGTTYTTTDAFVKNMFATSPAKTVIGFASQSGSNPIHINNVKFSEKTVDGWVKGSQSAILGDATEGFELSVAGAGFADNSLGNFYPTNTSVANLQVQLDLSTLTTSRNLWLSFGNDESAGIAGAWSTNNTKLLFVLKKADDTTLKFQGHYGGNSICDEISIADFDFSKTHTFEFLQDESGQWQPAIDSQLYPMQKEGYTTTNAFVENMFKTYPGKTVVGFATQNANVVHVKNVKFVEKTPEGWTKGTTSAVIGNATDGFELSASGDIFSNSKYGNYYASDIAVSNLKFTMDLSELAEGNNLWMIIANANGAPGAWSSTKASFMIKNVGGTQLQFGGHTGGAEVGTTKTVDFDFSSVHVFEFVKDGNAWKPSIDGTIYEVDCTTFVCGMLAASSGKTVVGFGAQGGTPLILKNITFSEKTVDGWTMGADSVVSGNATDGWTLSVVGVDAYSLYNSEYNNCYTLNYNVSDIRVLMDLSTMADGQEVFMEFGFNRSALSSNAWDGSKVFFKLKRSGNQLVFRGHNGTAEIGSADAFDFDFSRTHVFEFLKDENGKWQPAIDGTIHPMGDTNDTSTDYFVNYMVGELGAKTVVGFLRGNSTPCVINTVKFVPKLDATGATIATAFEGGVPIKMQFDYSVVKEYGYLEESETLVNYGAVLVAKTSEIDMQAALKAALPEGGKLEGTTYSEDYTYMFTAGKNAEVPDKYYVTIRNSDEFIYMDKDIRAIGYIVTETSDGSYRYYFTMNENADRNITAGMITKSVTDLLQAVCQEYVSIYNDAAEDSRAILEEVIATYNTDNGSTYTVTGETNSLEAVTQSTSLADLDKGLLKTVHLAMYQVPVVLKVSNYGAVGDGTTDDMAAVALALADAKTMTDAGKNIVLQFDKDKSYYFKGSDESTIFDLQEYKNLTLRGDNTTLLLDKTNELIHWFNINESSSITVQGFNLDLAQPMYTLSTVDAYKIYNGETYLSGACEDPYIDITTEISLGLADGETYIPGFAEDGSSEAFGLPYTGDVNRSHLYINSIEVLDAATNKYRVHIRTYDDYGPKIQYMYENDLPFMLGIPGWGRYGSDDGSGAVIVTNTTNLNLQDVNVWASPTIVFHMRNNYGVFNINNCNVTTKDADGELAAWIDVFHVKENRCKFVIEDCTFEKAQDDIFNFSTTILEVDEVYSSTEFNMTCSKLGGYWMPLRAGDTVTIFDEVEGVFVGRTTIKEVITQGVNTRIIVEDELSNLAELVANEGGVAVYVDSLGQPDSIIRNCTVSGTYRFRTSVTVEDCTLNTLYAWIDNYPTNEGPLPKDITFRGCTFNSVKPSQEQLNAGYISYISEDYMMQIGATAIVGTDVEADYFAENILFEDCTIDYTLIDFMGNTAYVTFKKDGEVYYTVKPDEQ